MTDYDAIEDDRNEREAVKSLDGLAEYRTAPTLRSYFIKDEDGQRRGFQELYDRTTRIESDTTMEVRR